MRTFLPRLPTPSDTAVAMAGVNQYVIMFVVPTSSVLFDLGEYVGHDLIAHGVIHTGAQGRRVRRVPRGATHGECRCVLLLRLCLRQCVCVFLLRRLQRRKFTEKRGPLQHY